MQHGLIQQETHQINTESEEPHLDNYDIDFQEDIAPKATRLHEIFGPYITSYVCILIPRIKEHVISVDLSEKLDIWMQDICISFGWHLNFIEVPQSYMHWIITVQMSTPTTTFMNIICNESSKKIFTDFPRFSQQNSSKKFWAPFYFVGVGDIPCSNKVIQSFIEQVRFEQGYS